MAGALGSGDLKAAIFQFFKGLGPFPQGIPGLERTDLLQQPVDQVAGQNLGVGRDVVDGLFRVDLRALPAGFGQGVDQVAAQLEQPSLENGKQAGGPGADDDQIGFYHDSFSDFWAPNAWVTRFISRTLCSKSPLRVRR